MLPVTVRQGRRLGSWNTNATRGLPLTWTCPAVGASNPAASRKIVVLPHPEDPIIDVNWLALKVRLTSSKTAGWPSNSTPIDSRANGIELAVAALSSRCIDGIQCKVIGHGCQTTLNATATACGKMSSLREGFQGLW